MCFAAALPQSFVLIRSLENRKENENFENLVFVLAAAVTCDVLCTTS